jgi:hypothetical protein
VRIVQVGNSRQGKTLMSRLPPVQLNVQFSDKTRRRVRRTTVLLVAVAAVVGSGLAERPKEEESPGTRLTE